MIMFAVSDVVHLAATVVTNIVVVGCLGLLAVWIKASTDRAAKGAAAQAEEVRKTLEKTTESRHSEVSEVERILGVLDRSMESQHEKIDNVAKTVASTHQLVNGALGEQMRLLAVTARAKAEVTHDPVDMAAAFAAEEAHEKHEKTLAESQN